MQIARHDLKEDAIPLWHRPALVYASIWLLALLVRLIYLLHLRGAPFFDMLMGDAEVYDAWGRQIAAGDWIGKSVFYQAPMYPYFLGTWYWIAGTNLWGVHLAQIVLGATSCALLAAAGKRFFSPLVGLIAGCMLALYPSAIFFDGLIQKSVLDNFFLTLLLLLLSCVALRPARPTLWILIGVSLACLALTRENALILPMLLVGWLVFYFRDQPWRKRAQWAGLLVLGMAMLLLPVAWRNHHVGGGFEVTTSQFGTNFYIGNNPRATGSYVPFLPGRGNPLFEQRDATELAEQATGKTLTPAQVSSYWSSQAFAYMREHPIEWLGLTGKKFFLTWNAQELSDTDNQYFTARWSWLLSGLNEIFHFGVICPLAAMGIALWQDRRRVWLLYLMLVGYSLSVAVFYVFARYRYPLAPILILFAAAGAVQIVLRIRHREYRWLSLATVVAIMVGLLVNWPSGMTNDGEVSSLYNVGLGMLKRGQLAEAADYSQQALRLDPNHWAAHNNLGLALQKMSRLQEAVEEYRQALRIKPDFAEAHYNLANALAETGRPTEAIEHYREALRLNPDFAEAHNNLGSTLGSQGNFSAAIAEYQEAIHLKPTYSEAYYNLGTVLCKNDRPQEGIDQYKLALEHNPDYIEAHLNLGVALAKLGQAEEAIEHFRKILQLKPDSLDAYSNLTTAYAGLHRRDEAIATAQQALLVARSKGQTAAAQQIEAWLRSYSTQATNTESRLPASNPVRASP